MSSDWIDPGWLGASASLPLTAILAMPTSRPASQGRGGKVLPEVEGLHKRSIYIREAQTEYVPTITEEERAALEYRARNEGWQSTRRLLRFYGKFLIPVFYCTTLFFICFSLLAYAIPNWLCHEAALESAVRRCHRRSLRLLLLLAPAVKQATRAGMQALMATPATAPCRGLSLDCRSACLMPVGRTATCGAPSSSGCCSGPWSTPSPPSTPACSASSG